MSTKDERAANEQAILDQIEGSTAVAEEIKGTPEDDFIFKAGRPLPPGFENPPCGDPDHKCVDLAGNYRPEWDQIMIEKIYDKQADPQVFPGPNTYAVYLDTWTDCPPQIKAALESAIETQHSRNANQRHIALGEHPKHKTVERRRFVWRAMPSA